MSPDSSSAGISLTTSIDALTRPWMSSGMSSIELKR